MTGSPTMDLPELIPARMLNEFVYCPRLCYLEFVQSEWADSGDTQEGRYVHRRVDSGAGHVLPVPGGEIPFQARSVMLSAPSEGLIARMDLVEGDGQEVVPVDYKKGSPPPVAEGAWEPERVQLCAQGLILRENGYRVSRGMLYFAEARHRLEIPIDDALVASTRKHLAEMRDTLARKLLPLPLVNSPKCPACSLAPICLPDEVNLLRQAQPPEAHRPLVPANVDAVPLYLQTQGARLGINGEVLEVHYEGKIVGRARLIDVSQVCLLGNIQVSTQAVRVLADHHVPVCYFSYGGWFSAFSTGMGHKNVDVRRAQFAAALDESRTTRLAQWFVEAKILNQRTFLRRNHRNVPPEFLTEMKRLAVSASRTALVETLLGLEGLAARLYFSHFGGMFKAAETPPFVFSTRNRRPPTDPVNALLSYGYSLLAKDFTIACLGVGLDPFQGFFHAIRYGRPSLALDLMEEFRPLIVDSAVLRVLNNGEVRPDDFESRGLGVMMKPPAKRAFLQAYERRMDEHVTHPVFGYKISYRQVLFVQARLLARCLQGEIERYPSFLTR